MAFMFLSAKMEEEFISDDNIELGKCPLCGLPLKLIENKGDYFLGCSNFPKCKYTFHVPFKTKVEIIKEIDGVKCPQCNGELAVKRGKYGLFIGCLNYPNCQFIYKDSKEIITCPKCGHGVIEQIKTKYNKIFWKCSNTSCDFTSNFPLVENKCESCGYNIKVIKKIKGKKIFQCLKCKTIYEK